MLESYITPLLTSYLNKYIKNLKPTDLQLSFWGGDAVLMNLELRLEAIEELLSSVAPFEMSSGNVKQLTVHIPWTSIGSEPIEVTFESVECTVKLKELHLSSRSKASETQPSEKAGQPAVNQPQAPGYLQGLLSRISNNVVLRVNNLVVKVIEEQCDLLMSISVKQLSCYAANDNWEKEFVFTDSLQGDYHLHNLCSVSDMTVCLDLIGSSGQVEVFESPFVPKCSLMCRLARYFKGGVFVETKLDVLCEGELQFSVSEQQFSLFLHFLDWLLAMYYSFKKLKGRDNHVSEEQDDLSEQNKQTTPSSAHSTPERHSQMSKQDVSTVSKNSQDNWGSWMMSFITGEDEVGTSDEQNSTDSSLQPPPTPTICLSVHASSISVAFTTTGCQQRPIFPSAFNKLRHTSRVVLMKFTGCMARVVKAPSTRLLAFSVGIMSVSAWICGSCPCEDHAPATSRRQRLPPADSMEQVHVYTLGTLLPETQIREQLLAGSLFGSFRKDPEHDAYLSRRDAYTGVWFSYVDLDVTREREIEECNQRLLIGKTELFLSLDVVHRLLHFILGFVSSLEAHPLLSTGITVIGDPRSKTELEFVLSAIKILITSRVHLISHKKQLLSPVSPSPPHIAALLCQCDGLQGKLILPTYSGNAVAEYPQCRLMDATLTGFSVCTTTVLAPGLDSFHSFTLEDPFLSLPSLPFNYYQQSFGEDGPNNRYCQISSAQNSLKTSSCQLLPVFMITKSWIDGQEPDQSSLLKGSDKGLEPALLLNLTNMTIEWSQNEAETIHSLVLGCVSFSLTYPNASKRPIPVLYSPSDTMPWNSIEAWMKGHPSATSPSPDKAVELYVCAPTETSEGVDSPQFKFTVAGSSACVSDSFLRYVESVPLHLLLPARGDADEDGDGDKMEAHSEALEAHGENDKTWLSWVKPYNVEVNISPLVVAFSQESLDCHGACTDTADYLSPVDVFSKISSLSSSVTVLALPSMVVSSGSTGLHPAMTALGSTSDPRSWHFQLTRGAILTLMSGSTEYLLHPLSLEVSIATVKSSTSPHSYGLGVHMDVKDLHLSLNKPQVTLILKLLSMVTSACAAASSSPVSSSSSPSATTPSVPQKESSSGYAPSLTPSPHLSQLSLSIPLPPSESSASTFTTSSVFPSLWLQVTLSKLIIDLRTYGKRASTCESDSWFVIEAEDTSLSVDLQEKWSSYNFKVFSLEAKTEPFSSISAVMDVRTPFTKLFSSTSSVLREEASEGMEVVSPPSSALPPHTPPLSNFLTVDAVTHSSAHRPTEVCVRVQNFEAVVWLEFLKCVLEIMAAFDEGILKDTKRKESTDEVVQRHIGVEFWPHVNVYFKCFHILLPTTSLSSTLILDCGELTVTSDLNFPVSRLTIDATSLRKLESLSAEKQQPPLPGYQLSARSVSAKMITISETENWFKVTSLSSPTNVRVVYSPPLSYLSTSPYPSGLPSKPATGGVLAAGLLAELHFDTDFDITITPDEVKVVLEWFKDVSQVFTTASTTGTNQTTPQPHSVRIPVQVLVTGRTVNMLLPSCERKEEQGENGRGNKQCPMLKTSFFNPVMLVNVGKDTSFEFSLFNLAAGITYGEEREEYKCLPDARYMSVVETRPGTVSNSTSSDCNSSLPANLVTAKVAYKENEAQSMVVSTCVEVGRPLKVSLSPSVADLFLEHIDTLLNSSKTKALQTVPPHPSTSIREQSDLLSVINSLLQLKVTTSQVVIEVLEGANKETKDGEREEEEEKEDKENEILGRLIASWEEMSVVFPVENGEGGVDASIGATVSGVQLVCCCGHVGNSGGSRSFIMVAPTTVECTLSHHSRQSTYDSPHTAVFLSCGLLRGEISRLTLAQADRILQTFLKVFTKLNKGDRTSSHESDVQGGPLESEQELNTHPREERVQFVDDLKRGEFKFVTDKTEDSTKPGPGEVTFMEEREEVPMSMMWRYREPREITRVQASPVPLFVHGRDMQHANLKVICTLCQWMDEKSGFVPVATFSVSESTPVAVEVKPHPPARLWSIMVSGVEWTELEEGGHEINNRVELPSTKFDVSTIFSPLALAACTRVDSCAIPLSLSTFSLAMAVTEASLLLMHLPSSKERSSTVKFEEFTVYDDLSLHPLELGKLTLTNWSSRFTLQADQEITVEVGCSVSLKYVDLQDLTWVTGLSGAEISACYQTKLPHNVPQPIGVAQTNVVVHEMSEQPRCPPVETNISMRISPLAVRLGPSLVHTAVMTSYLCGHGNSDKQPIICSHYIICNNTVASFKLRQVTTSEDTLLPAQSCIGYVWRNYRVVPKLLQVCMAACSTGRWSKPFSVDCEDNHQVISLSSDAEERSTLLGIFIKSIGGFQKMVTLVGGLKFSSNLPFPLSLQLVSPTEPVSNPDIQYQSLSVESNQLPQTQSRSAKLHLPASGDGQLASLVVADAAGVQVCQTGQTRWSSVLPIGSCQRGWTKPQLMAEIPSCDGVTWCWVRSMFGEQVEELPSVEVTFAPLLAVTNLLPFDVELAVVPTNDVHSLSSTFENIVWCTVSGCGQTTVPQGMRIDQSNVIYLKHGDSPDVSPPLSFLLPLVNQLPVCTVDCVTCECPWPYSDCTHDQPISHDTHMTDKTVVSLTCLGRKHQLVISFQRHTKGTATLLLTPQCLLVNQLAVPLSIKLTEAGDAKGEEQYSLDAATTLPLSYGEVHLGVGNGQVKLWSDSVSVTNEHQKLMDHKVTFTGYADQNVTGSLLVRRRIHYGCLVCTILPTHLLVNQTGLVLKGLHFHESLSAQRGYCEEVNSVTHVAPNDHTALLFWQTSQDAPVKTLRLTACTSLSAWSIPLSLNYVRRSFSLPCDTDDGTTNLPCILSTHELKNVNYAVISKDHAPRLVVSNLSLKALEVTEAGETDLYCRPQPLGIGEKVAYEPASLAKQYPLINANKEDETERGSRYFKTVNQVMLKLRLLATSGEEGKEWSKPFHLHLDSEQVVRVPNYEALFATVSFNKGTVHVSLIPMTGKVVVTDIDSILTQKPPHKPLSVACSIKELVVCMDFEQPGNATTQSVAKITVESIDMSFSRTSEESSGSIVVSSVQVDNIMSSRKGESGGYKVILVPRREHSPPHQLVKTNAPPFLSICFRKAIFPTSLFYDIHVSAQPVTIQFDSCFLQNMKSVLAGYQFPETMKSQVVCEEVIPSSILAEADQDHMPLVINSLVLDELMVYMSARITLKVALSCDDTLLKFPRYELANVYSNKTEVSNCLAAHYTTQLLWQVWWGLGSLDLIGSPTVLFHSIRSGVSDFFSLPYEGLTMGPGFFLIGLGQGVTALVGSLSGGMLRSLSNFSSAVAQNMEKLSLDPEHASYQEEYRRRGEPPVRLTTGIATGASSFGLSVVSALAGVVDQPMRGAQAAGEAELGMGGYAANVLRGFGKGLLGVVTKPVGGALQLVSQTSQGLMSSVGLLHTPQQKATSNEEFCAAINRTKLSSTVTRYTRLLLISECSIMFSTLGTVYTSPENSNHPCHLLVTAGHLLVILNNKDQFSHCFSLHKHAIHNTATARVPGEIGLIISQTQLQHNHPCGQVYTSHQGDGMRESQTITVEQTPTISLATHCVQTLHHFFNIASHERNQPEAYFNSY